MLKNNNLLFLTIKSKNNFRIFNFYLPYFLENNGIPDHLPDEIYLASGFNLNLKNINI